MNLRERRGDQTTLIDYGHMDPEELVDHFIDENGLARFIDVQQRGVPREDWDWRALTVFLQAFTKRRLTFSPEYLQDLYKMQLAREAIAEEAAA